MTRTGCVFAAIVFIGALVADASADAAGPDPSATCCRLEDRSTEISWTLPVGLRTFRSLQGLDDALRASGYGRFGRAAPSVGLATDLVVWRRWRLHTLLSDAWTAADGPAGSIHADVLEAEVAAGYEFLHRRGLTGYALLGFGAAQFRMDARGPKWDYLGSQAAVLGNPDAISRDGLILTTEAGFQQFVLLPVRWADGWGLVVALRLGYTQQLSLASWVSTAGGSGSVEGTHDMNLGGTWIALGVGPGYVR